MLFMPIGLMAPVAAAAPAGTAVVGTGTFAGTFSRASAGTYRSASTIQTAATDVPRFQNGRLLMERERTNYFRSTPSADRWSTDETTLTQNAGAAPDGSNTAVLVSSTTAADRHNTETFAYQPAYRFFAFSGYFKHAGYNIQFSSGSAGGGTYAYFDLVNGVAGPFTAYGAYSNASVLVRAAGNGWYYCCLRYYTSEGEAYSSINLTDRLTHTAPFVFDNPSFTGNGGGAYAWGVQLEEGTTEGSLIPSVEPPTSRAGDVATYTLSPSQAVGTVTGQFFLNSISPDTDTRLVAMLYNSPEELQVQVYGSTFALGRWNGSDWLPVTVGTVTAGAVQKFALGWSGGTASISFNGAAAVALSGVSTVGYSKLTLGGRGDTGSPTPDQLQGEIGPVAIHTTRMTDSQLAAASA